MQFFESIFQRPHDICKYHCMVTRPLMSQIFQCLLLRGFWNLIPRLFQTRHGRKRRESLGMRLGSWARNSPWFLYFPHSLAALTL